MTLLDKVKDMARLKNISLAELERKLDFSQGSISRWNTQSPSCDRLKKLADFFSVSTDYLLDRTDNPQVNNMESTPLVEPATDLSEKEKEEVLQYIEFLKSKHK